MKKHSRKNRTPVKEKPLFSNKKRFFTIASVLLSLVVMLAVYLFSDKQTPSADQKRFSVFVKWADPTKKFVEKINDPEVNLVWEYVYNHMTVAKPVKYGHQHIGVNPNIKIGVNKFLTFVPLLPGDEKIGKWKSFFDGTAVAVFMPTNNVIILKSFYDFTDNGKVMIFLHEAYHAYSYSKKIKGIVSSEQQVTPEYLEEEILAHTFQNKIMLLIGGEDYKRHLEEEILLYEKLLGEYQKQVPDAIAISPPRENPGLILALLKEAPRSRKETTFFQTSAMVHSVYTFFDRKYPPAEAHKRKMNYMMAFYNSYPTTFY